MSETNGNGAMNDGLHHKQPPEDNSELGCQTNMGAMNYDDSCLRCSKIKIVIYLRRKSPGNGCSEAESTAAMALADKIIAKFQLTRGDIFDREYNAVAITRRVMAQKTYHDKYGAANVRNQPWNKTSRVNQTQMNKFFKQPNFMSDF